MTDHPSRREFLHRVTSTAATLALARAAVAETPDTATPPNILLIMSDDHTTQAVGCYGRRLSDYAHTPHIDRLADEGMLFENCFCTNAICVPSRASILTGQYSHVHGLRALQKGFPPSSDNFAKRLRQAGYQTMIAGKWHLKNQPSGFDQYQLLPNQGEYFDPSFRVNGEDWEDDRVVKAGYSTDLITDTAMDMIAKRDRSRPFMMVCSYKAPHDPYHNHPRNGDLYADQTIPEPEDLHWPESPKGRVHEGWPLEGRLKRKYLNKPERYPGPPLELDGEDPKADRSKLYQKFIKDYLRTVAGIDQNVGRLTRFLDQKGLRENTIVVYTADQGYFLGEHNLFDKRYMYDEAIRMPLIVRYPKLIKPGIRSSEMVTNVDFAPTLLDLAGVPIPPSMQGRSVRPLLDGKTPADWPQNMYYHYWDHHWTRRPSHYGVRTHSHKLIYFYGLLREGRAPEACWELYDLKEDPHERVNVYGNPEYARVTADLKEQLNALRRKYNDTEDPLKTFKGFSCPFDIQRRLKKQGAY